MLGGLAASLILIALSPAVWPGPDSEGSPVPLANPALISFPIGFLSCWIGTVLSREARDERYRELRVRAETGLGAH